jgi:hypothetical protein
MTARRALAWAPVAALGVALACSSPSPDPRFVATPPDRASFPPVEDLLEHRCGSIDCHGTVARNLRLFGNEGLRLDPASRPSSQPNTTPAEYDEDYASLVGLEPEIMSAVVASGGAHPERLTFIRKARGLEDHKGGSRWVAGDPEDTCVTSWLAGHADSATCVSARASAF